MSGLNESTSLSTGKQQYSGRVTDRIKGQRLHLTAAYKAGESVDALAAQYGVSTAMIYNAIKELSSQEAREMREWRKFVDEDGLTILQAAKAMGITDAHSYRLNSLYAARYGTRKGKVNKRDLAMLEMFREGHTIEAVMVHYDVTRRVVRSARNRLRKAGYKFMTRGFIHPPSPEAKCASVDSPAPVVTAEVKAVVKKAAPLAAAPVQEVAAPVVKPPRKKRSPKRFGLMGRLKILVLGHA